MCKMPKHRRRTLGKQRRQNRSVSNTALHPLVFVVVTSIRTWVMARSWIASSSSIAFSIKLIKSSSSATRVLPSRDPNAIPDTLEPFSTKVFMTFSCIFDHNCLMSSLFRSQRTLKLHASLVGKISARITAGNPCNTMPRVWRAYQSCKSEMWLAKEICERLLVSHESPDDVRVYYSVDEVKTPWAGYCV